MITQRIAIALRRQDWTIILIEFVLVIVGVLIALELDQWNGARAEDAREIKILMEQRDAVKRDMIDLQNAARAFASVAEFGRAATASLQSDTCSDQCWNELVAFFHASQWIDVELTRATYDEMKRSGYPRDELLRAKLTRYYSLDKQTRKITAELPRYRELVRSLIPAKTQEHLWAECFKYTGRDQTLIGDCAPPKESEQIRETVMRLKATPEVQASLNYWLSTVAVVKSSLPNQLAEAQSLIEALSSYMENAK